MTESKHPEGHILQAFHDQELPAALSRDISDHCETCDVCQAILKDLERVENIFSHTREPSMTHSIWQKVRPEREQKIQVNPVFAMAACLVGIILGVLLGPLQFSPNSQNNDAAWSDNITLWSQDSESLLSSVYQTGTE